MNQAQVDTLLIGSDKLIGQLGESGISYALRENLLALMVSGEGESRICKGGIFINTQANREDMVEFVYAKHTVIQGNFADKLFKNGPQARENALGAIMQIGADGLNLHEIDYETVEAETGKTLSGADFLNASEIYSEDATNQRYDLRIEYGKSGEDWRQILAEHGRNPGFDLVKIKSGGFLAAVIQIEIKELKRHVYLGYGDSRTEIKIDAKKLFDGVALNGNFESVNVKNLYVGEASEIVNGIVKDNFDNPGFEFEKIYFTEFFGRLNQPSSLDWEREREIFQQRMEECGSLVRQSEIIECALVESITQLQKHWQGGFQDLTAEAIWRLMENEQLLSAQICIFAAMLEAADRHAAKHYILAAAEGEELTSSVSWRYVPGDVEYGVKSLITTLSSRGLNSIWR